MSYLNKPSKATLPKKPILPPSMVMRDPLYTSAQAAEYLTLTRNTLCYWRTAYPARLPFLKLGAAVRYRQSELDAYLQKHTVTNGAGVSHG